ncbi:MAG: ABC transporter ATP-binding protein [Bifidobacterium sp.]|jgi:ABC-type glutathione transport system ATPase component|nr:ABC transporter ATP-binding protein [Bifidobacterium sp.]
MFGTKTASRASKSMFDAWNEDMPILQVKSLSIDDAEGNRIVNDVSFDVQSQEAHALVGESGSGKSLTLKAIIRLLDGDLHISQGSILFKGVDVLTLSEAQMGCVRGKGIAMVFQEPAVALNPVLKVGRQISDAYQEHAHVDKREAWRKAISLLKDVGIPEPERKASYYPFQFSGGMRQRVMIAASLSLSPALILCDEPTTALDVTIQAQILKLFASMRDQLHASMLYVTHDLAVARELCTSATVMNKGSIVEEGDIRQIFGAPKHPYTQRLVASMPDIAAEKHDIDAAQLDYPILKIDNIDLTYRGLHKGEDFQALKDVTLRVVPGHVTALVGESGSGKSTIAKAIMGIEPITSGTMELDRKELVMERDLHERAKVQMVFQDLYSSLDLLYTARSTLTEVLRLHFGTTLSKQQIQKCCEELMDEVQLPRKFLDESPRYMSGGQRQRLVIARALCTQPKLLIADEATSALDVTIQAEIIALFKKLAQERHIGILFIAHDLAVVKDLSDWVYVIQHGRIVESGLTGQVFSQPQEEYTRQLISSIPGIEYTNRYPVGPEKQHATVPAVSVQ